MIACAWVRLPGKDVAAPSLPLHPPAGIDDAAGIGDLCHLTYTHLDSCSGRRRRSRRRGEKRNVMLMRFQLRLVGAIISSDGGHSMWHAACGMVRNAFGVGGKDVQTFWRSVDERIHRDISPANG